MKKRITCIICAILMLLCALAGCGRSYNGATESAVFTSDSNAGGAIGFTEEDFEVEYQETGSTVVRNAKLIYTASVNIQTLEFDNAVASLEKMTVDMGGYMERSETYSGGYYSGGSVRSAYYTVRVPAEKFESFLNTVGEDELFHVTNMSRSADDIGMEYYDTETRLKTQKVKQERLLSLLEKADNMEDIISLETALAEVEYMIENYSSTLNRYDDLVGFATIDVTIDEVARVVETGESTSFKGRVSAAFNNGVNSFAAAMEDFAVWLAASILPLILIAIVVALAIIIPIKVSRKKKHINAEIDAEQETEKGN